MTALAPPVGTSATLADVPSRRSPLVAAVLDPEQALARSRAWAATAAPRAVVEAVHVGSVLYRPDGGCSLRYRVLLAPPDRERTLLLDVPASGTDVAVRPFPADPALPTLPAAVDPVLMRGVLGRVVPGTGGERAIGRCAVDVVHHPRRHRCVLRYRLSPGPGGEGELRHPVLYGKVYADSTAGAAASALRLLRRSLTRLPDGGRVHVPEPLAVVPGMRLLLSGVVPGRPRIAELLGAVATGAAAGPDPGRSLRDAVGTAARLLAAVHRCDPGAGPLPLRDLPTERAATEREVAGLGTVWPRVAEVLRPALARAHERSGPVGGLPATVLAHGDWTPSQVLLAEDGGAGVVDVDTLCRAEPASDLGRFLAYLHVAAVRRSSGPARLPADLTETFVGSYRDAMALPAGAGGRRAGEQLLDRIAAYRALSLVRLGASACWQLKDGRLQAVLHVLDEGDEWRRSGTG